MKITFQQDGGVAFIPGLAEPLTVDTDVLVSDEAAELERLVLSSNILGSSPAAGPDPSASKGRDQRTYLIVVEYLGQEQSLRFSDPVPSEAQPLVQALKMRLRQRQRRKS